MRIFINLMTYNNTNIEPTGSNFAKISFPLGIRDSIASVEPDMVMPLLASICPAIGALATNVKVSVHGQMNSLNLISYVVGNAASGKGSLDPVIEAWVNEIRTNDDVYHALEDDYRRLVRSGMKASDLPAEPKCPIRFLTLNTTVANLADRLANTAGSHAFSFTPEADTVAKRWKSSVSDFSVMIRQAYDASRYEREAHSINAVTVHIRHLLWNVVMCGTHDALYRVISNFTDGLLTRVAIARMPDNTFQPLGASPRLLSDDAITNISQVAHLLPLMSGELYLDRLEAHGRRWLEKVRLAALKNDDHTMASQRMRICVTSQRMVTAVMLCAAAEKLLANNDVSTAEAALRNNPQLLQQMMTSLQSSSMLRIFDVIADSLLANVLDLFRDKIERSSQISSSSSRLSRGSNDTIFDSLPHEFNVGNATIAKGGNASSNSVRMMLRNWTQQGLISRKGDDLYVKTA